MAFDYDLIIVGSGLAGTLVANELLATRKPLRILMLERGLWWFPRDRPAPAAIQPVAQYLPSNNAQTSPVDLLSVVWTNHSFDEGLQDFFDRPQPLYRYHMFDQIDV